MENNNELRDRFLIGWKEKGKRGKERGKRVGKRWGRKREEEISSLFYFLFKKKKEDFSRGATFT